MNDQMEGHRELKLAVLIDADNIPYANVKEMLEEITRYGIPTFKRIYADWTNPTVSGWKNVLLENAITPIQQYAYTTGKNSTDSAMIIDAMDILYTGKVDGFCIVSSDSDFTRLATRLREAGMKVIGIGEKKTPAPFISACEKFIYLEILKPQPTPSVTPAVEGASKGATKSQETIGKVDKFLKLFISNAITEVANESGWAHLANVGERLLKIRPDFDPRNYGFPKLLPLIKSIGNYEVEERGSTSAKAVYVRLKGA